jgi:hypothetical protein
LDAHRQESQDKGHPACFNEPDDGRQDCNQDDAAYADALNDSLAPPNALHPASAFSGPWVVVADDPGPDRETGE